MILTESKLKQIISEELENLLSEEQLDEGIKEKFQELSAGAKEKFKKLIKRGIAPATAVALAASAFAGGQQAGDDAGLSRHAVSGQTAEEPAQGNQDRKPRPNSRVKRNKGTKPVGKHDEKTIFAKKFKDRLESNEKISDRVKTAAKFTYSLHGASNEKDFIKFTNADVWSQMTGDSGGERSRPEQYDRAFIDAFRTEFGETSPVFMDFMYKYNPFSDYLPRGYKPSK